MIRRLALLAILAAISGAGCTGKIDRVSPGSGAAVSPGAGVGANGATPAADGGLTSLPTTDCDKAGPAPRRLWRLTPNQYDNTLHDLLGIDSTFGQGFPADDLGAGFSNGSDTLRVSALLADKLQAAAQTAASKVDLTRFAPCATSQPDDDCLRQFVSQLGEQAFRRPMQTADVDRYVALAKTSGDFESGARLAVNAMLESPYFMYRFELGQPSGTAGQYRLDDYEIASELSYLLWQSMPDATLFAAAKSGQLHEAAQVASQVQRMLKSDRARPVVRAFVFDWLGLTAIATVPKDAKAFPDLTSDLRSALHAEAERFVDHVMFDGDGSVASLLTSPTTYLDAQLATFYGVQLPAAGSDPQAIALPQQERRGILTLGGTLITHSRSNDSSPIQRGKLVRERFLCQPLPPPPAGLNIQPPAVDPTKTARERYVAHTAVGICSNCHRLMDPIGFSFEHFDGIGRFRSDENGLPIDVTGEVISYNPTDIDGTFKDNSALIDKLAGSEDVQRCYALEWFRFAFGEQSDTPSCYAQRFQQAISGGDGSLTTILSTLTQSDWLLVRGPGEQAAATSDAGTPALVAPAGMDAGTPNAGAPAPVSTTPTTTTPDAGTPTSVPMDLQVSISVDNDWGQGYCRTYQLHNTGSGSITWSIPLQIRGTMNNHWECSVSADSGMVTFSGVDYNSTLAPGAMAEFGYCAQTP
jgi:hypothetical protein